jgi:hypothetical protein
MYLYVQVAGFIKWMKMKTSNGRTATKMHSFIYLFIRLFVRLFIRSFIHLPTV